MKNIMRLMLSSLAVIISAGCAFAQTIGQQNRLQN